MADAGPDEAEGLHQAEEGRHGRELGRVLTQAGLVGLDAGIVHEVLTRRVVVGDDHDGALALHDGGTGAAVYADHILTVHLGAEPGEQVGDAQVVEPEQDDGDQHEQQAHDGDGRP